MGSCHGAHSVPEKAALQGHCPAWALMIQAPTRVNLVVGRVARPAMRSQGFLAIGSGSARSHHQGSEECRHSYECLLMAQWQTEDLEGTVANRLWRWYAHRPEDSEDMVANRLWRWHAHGSIYSMGDF